MSAAAGAGDAQYRKMTQTPIPRLVTTLAVPTIISMLVTAVYNMADTFFVAQLGTSAAGAVGIVFSLMAVIQAIGFMLGMGAGNLVSRYLGAKEQRQADCAASTAFFTALAFGLGITVLGTLFLDPLMRVLGATPTILPYARITRYILFGAPVMCASFVLNNILRARASHAGHGGHRPGGVLNIGLDPLFIYTFGLGIAGAAIATLLSQCVSFAILLACFLRRKSAVRLHIGQVSRKAEVYARIIKTGMPSFCRQSLASVATVLLNVNAAVYGDAAVAAMSVVGRIFMFVFSFMLGFGQGFQPVAGYNFGAKRYDRVRGATYFTMLVGTVLMSVLAAAGFLAAPGALALFRRDDAEVIAIGALALRAQCVVLPLFGVSTVTNMLLQVTGQSGQATFLSLCRQGIFFVPFILLLPQLIGLLGVQLAQPAADLCTFAVTLPFLLSFLRRLKLWEQAKQ
ncbi:MAG: MATE family efflux transporter [Ruthenibacterium lactatiformans]